MTAKTEAFKFKKVNKCLGPVRTLLRISHGLKFETLTKHRSFVLVPESLPVVSIIMRFLSVLAFPSLDIVTHLGHVPMHDLNDSGDNYYPRLT